MESNRSLLFFIFGISLLPKIYSDGYPSLFIMMGENEDYVLADKFEYVGNQYSVVKFVTLPTYHLYNTCPEENAPHYQSYALKVKDLVTEFKGEPLKKFIRGSFDEYNCPTPIEPIVLKYKQENSDKDKSRYDIGFLLHDENINSNKLSERYENFPDVHDYELFTFLNIIMNFPLGTIISVHHVIIAGKLREPDLDWDFFQLNENIPPNENNDDIFGFDLNYLYTEENQKKIFSSIFDSSASLYYEEPNQRLVKVQLAPHKDFVLDIWKLTTFMDINTTAMWKTLLPRWKKVEAFVRDVARKLGELSVETGAARILSLRDGSDRLQPIYLGEGETVPLARYFWKLIKFRQFHHKYYTKAILIVMHNDPYTPDQQPICNVTHDFGWLVSNDDYETGLTYMCQVDQDITSKLYDDFKVNYEPLNLQYVHKLVYDENTGGLKWVNENITLKILNHKLIYN